jgi:hypothetical protein
MCCVRELACVHACVRVRVCATCPSVMLTCLRVWFMRISSIDDSQNTWQEHLASTPGKHTWQAHLARTPGKHTWQAHLASTPGKHTWQAHLASTPARRGTRQVCALCRHVRALHGAVRRTPHRAACIFAASSLSSRNAYAPLRTSRSDLRPQRVKARNAVWLRNLGRIAQRAARRAWYCAMWVLSSARQPKRQRGPKRQSVAPADCAGPTAKRMGKAECPKGHLTHGPGVLCAPKRQTRTEQLGPSLRG